MKYSDYNSTEFNVGKKRGNRYVSSSLVDNQRTSSIAIISAILALAIITCAILVVFKNDFYFPTWIGDRENTTPRDHPITVDPSKDYPYATSTSKTKFVASTGGTGLGGLGLNSQYAILINTSDMSTVAHKNADAIIYPASMTKVMTVITALDYIEDLDDVYTFHPAILRSLTGRESAAGMKYVFEEYGINTYTIRDLLYGISYKSGADSVVCLLDYFDVSMEEFATLMNQKAEEIGLENTTFGGAIGMDHENNQTTCRDMAAIMTYAMENEYARQFFSGGKHRFDLHDGFSYYHSTLDTLLDKMDTSSELLLGNYTVIAAKSGLETNAGYCLVSYIKNDKTGECFVLVTGKAEKHSDWTPAANPINDMVKIFEELKP